MRRSRRLRGLAPEEQAIEQVCFICQLRIHVNHLGRCVSTPCCHVFMHRSCYNNMVERLPTCGNCRNPNVDHVPEGDDTVILEADEEVDVDELEEGIVARILRIHNRFNEYRLFFYNTPYEVFDVFATFRFRLFFSLRSERTDVEIQHLELLPHSGGPSVYPNDFGWI